MSAIGEDSKYQAALELLKIQLEEARALRANFIQVTSLYLVLVGALLKFGVENDDLEAKLAFFLAGMVFSVGGVLATKFGFKARDLLRSELEALKHGFDLPVEDASAATLTYVLKIVVGTCVIGAAGFAVLIVWAVWFQ